MEKTSVIHPNPELTLLWPQIPSVESSLLQDSAISGFVGQSGDTLMAHRSRRGCRPLLPPAPRTQLAAGDMDPERYILAAGSRRWFGVMLAEIFHSVFTKKLCVAFQHLQNVPTLIVGNVTWRISSLFSVIYTTCWVGIELLYSTLMRTSGFYPNETWNTGNYASCLVHIVRWEHW